MISYPKSYTVVDLTAEDTDSEDGAAAQSLLNKFKTATSVTSTTSRTRPTSSGSELQPPVAALNPSESVKPSYKLAASSSSTADSYIRGELYSSPVVGSTFRQYQQQYATFNPKRTPEGQKHIDSRKRKAHDAFGPPNSALRSPTLLPAARIFSSRNQSDLSHPNLPTNKLPGTQTSKIQSGHGRAAFRDLLEKARAGVIELDDEDDTADTQDPPITESKPESRELNPPSSGLTSSVGYPSLSVLEGPSPAAQTSPSGLGSTPRIVPLSPVEQVSPSFSMLMSRETTILVPSATSVGLAGARSHSPKQNLHYSELTVTPHTFVTHSTRQADASFGGVNRARISALPEHGLHNTTRSRVFDASILPKRQGIPFTIEELIMIGYLKDELNLPWHYIDRKMGRTNNCCATKHLRKVKGLNDPQQKVALRYYERVSALKAIVSTVDVTIEQALAILGEFIRSERLPVACAKAFETIYRPEEPEVRTKNVSGGWPQPFLGVPDPLPALSAVIDTQSVESNQSISERLRPSARTSTGELAVKSLFRRTRENSLGVLVTPALSSSDTSEVEDELQYSRTSTLVPKDLPIRCFIKRQKPYLSYAERKNLKLTLESVDWGSEGVEAWDGMTLHLDLSPAELKAVENSVRAVAGDFISSTDHVDVAQRISLMIRDATQAEIVAIANHAKESPELKHRTRKSIQSFLVDATLGLRGYISSRFRISQKQELPQQFPFTARLLNREMGIGARDRPGSYAPQRIQDQLYDSITPSVSFTGASGDVGTVSWCPDGNCFAVGSVCLADPSSMQYNRPNNLLFGNMQHRTLYELPDHARPRERPNEGINSSYSMHVSQDPRLFETVSIVDFASDGSFMYSAGYDKFLRAYEVKDGRAHLRWASDHGAKVDLLNASRNTSLLATGCQEIDHSVRVWRNEDGVFTRLFTDGSTKARQYREKKAYPSCLRWGSHTMVENYLLAGFASMASDDISLSYGEMCLWDVTRQTPVTVLPSAGNIFDCSWSPVSCIFATACVAYGHKINRGTHSLVRVYSPMDENRWSHKGMELECPARDINDVVFCPYDQHYVAAGATDGQVYVWDLRNPDYLLHRFEHGTPLTELDPDMPRELADTGVRFCAWNQSRTRLHTGSSDGVVKVWDIFQSPENAHIQDIASFNSGIMSGAFSPDFSSLLIGEVNGSINVLEVGAESRPLKDIDSFHLESATTEKSHSTPSPPVDEESGVRIGRRLRKRKQIKFRPLGGLPMRQAVQGKRYVGPYDGALDAEKLRKEAAEFQERMKVTSSSEQCNIPHCRKFAITRVTSEETGDSCRALDRIPQALRAAAGKKGSMIPGMLKCSHCGSPARPRTGDLEQELFPLCERCGFACFRCGERVKVSAAVERVACHTCALEWDAGALGYDLLETDTDDDTTTQSSIESKARKEKQESGGLDDLTDLLHLVEDYHHSFWQDRPLSPL